MRDVMKRVCFIILLVGVFSGCSDFLEPKSQNEYVPKTAAALNEMLLGSAYPKASGRDLMSLLPMLDDDLACSDTLGGIISSTFERDIEGLKALFSWQPDLWITMKREMGSLTYRNYWEEYYQCILGANAALDYVGDVKGSAEEVALVKAQAYALRAFYYFQLVNMFGEPYNYNKKALGVPLKVTSAMEDKDLARNTVEEVYAQIVSDLTDAEECYESVPEGKQFQLDYRTNLPMVQLLKSRVYLYMEDWDNAMTYARKVIDNPNFSLINFDNLFGNKSTGKDDEKTYYNFISMENSTECIWTFGDISAYIRLIDISLSVPQDPENPMIGEEYQYRFFNAAPELLTSYVDGDLRKEEYILKGRSQMGSDYRPDGYFAYGKFAITAALSPARGTNFAHAFRLAEAYLNLAEAAAKKGENDIALEALNTLRENRFAADEFAEIEGVSGDALVEKIRLERRLELCYEGHRWFDLRRYGMPAFTRVWKIGGVPVKSYRLEEKDPAYVLPIPQDVMEMNRNLEQNKLANPR